MGHHSTPSLHITMASLQEDDVRRVLGDLLNGIDEDTAEYFTGMIMESGGVDEETLTETLAPFLESYGISETEEDASILCSTLCKNLKEVGMESKSKSSYQADAPTKLEMVSKLGTSLLSESEQNVIDNTMWGLDSIRKRTNVVMPGRSK
jgi:hypothetical protein